MVVRREESWLACPADGITKIDHTVLGLDGLTEINALGGIFVSVEIMTNVASRSLDRAIEIATVDTITCGFGEATICQYIPEIHMGQGIQQLLVLGVCLAVYLSAYETGVLCVVIV